MLLFISNDRFQAFLDFYHFRKNKAVVLKFINCFQIKMLNPSINDL